MPGKRDRLARQRHAMGMTQEQLAVQLGVERSTVYRWESGEVAPRPNMQPKLARALSVTPAELTNLLVIDSDPSGAPATTRGRLALTSVTSGNPRFRQPLTEATVPRRAHDYQGRIDIGGSPRDFLAGTVVETPLPSRLGWTEVEHVRATTRAVAMSENLFGGGLSCEAAAAQLRWAGQLLEVQAPNEVHRCVAEAVGNLASVVAFSAFDIANYAAADRCFEFALWCADYAGSWALRANTLAEMARKAAYLGDLDDALELIEFAQVRSDRITATARAMLTTIRARLLALTGRYVEAQADVDRADAHFADHEPEADPPWLCYYDAAEHQGSTGKALIPLAQARSNPELAAGRLDAAIRLQAAEYPRSRTFSRVRLASLMMATGYPREAVPIGRQAVIDTATLRSKRLMTELHGLARTATPHVQLGDVAELRHDIATLGRAAT
ncbi:helix-turn-helix domain-containing protein [Sciscionella marina]|uniref:helix-turn-helix domain-containing protein n=1 Tax=Sciscionella marina TaxID=508770 RepID=UPI000A07AEED|nr:helix-turn-helix transcriptional regulator [Sciscionella marina]